MYQNTVWRKQLFFFFFFAALNKFHLNRFGIKKFSEFYTCDEHVVYVWKLNRKSVSFLPLFNYTFQLYLAKKIFYTRKIFNICTIDNKFTFILIIIHKLLPIENIANFVIITFQKNCATLSFIIILEKLIILLNKNKINLTYQNYISTQDPWNKWPDQINYCSEYIHRDNR